MSKALRQTSSVKEELSNVQTTAWTMCADLNVELLARLAHGGHEQRQPVSAHLGEEVVLDLPLFDLGVREEAGNKSGTSPEGRTF